jgi:hypothetical protein
VLAWWSLTDCSPIIHYERASSSSVHLHISMKSIWMTSFKHMFSSSWLILNLHFISFYCNLEANLWFKHWLWITSTNITQCKH